MSVTLEPVPVAEIELAHELAKRLAIVLNASGMPARVASLAAAQVHASTSISIGLTEVEHMILSEVVYRECKKTADRQEEAAAEIYNKARREMN